MEKILFVEDEETIAMAVTEVLQTKGYEVWRAPSAEGAIKAFPGFAPQLCILDVMLPGMDGFALATRLRELNKDVPILFLSARSTLNDVLEGFQSGGDDYLKKPFSLAELLVRVSALLKRNSPKNLEQLFRFNGYSFDKMAQFILTPTGEKHTLSHRETELFHLLISHKNEILYRQEALLKIWGDDHFFNARTMDVFISRLRKLFKEDPSIQIINIRAVGYKLVIQD